MHLVLIYRIIQKFSQQHIGILTSCTQNLGVKQRGGNMKKGLMIVCLIFMISGFFSDTWAIPYNDIEFPDGAVSFADVVVSYTPGSGVADEYLGVPADPETALGVPDFEYYFNEEGWPIPTAGGCIPLGNLGELVLQFTDNALTTSGNDMLDLWIFEVGYDEPTDVSISADGTNWIYVGSTSGADSGIDIDAYIGSGVLSGELYTYVKLVDLLPATTPYPLGGADIDAVGAISSVSPVPEPGTIFLLGTGLIGLASLRRRFNP